MELKKTMINLCELCAKGTAQTMADGDVIVPDTKPDILKLLQVDSDACITDKYIENGKLVLCGKVFYKVLYIPDGDNEKIKSILTSMDFRQVVEAKNADSDANIIAKAMVERVEFNTVNSRKLRLRAVIHIDYDVCRIYDSEITCDVDSDDIERKTQMISFENVVNVSDHEFTVKEKLEVNNGELSISEILKSDIKICDSEYKAVTGKVIIKGILGICVLYTDDEGNVKFIESETPFTEVLDADGVDEDSICDIDYSIIGVMCSPEPDIDGDLRDVVLDVDLTASLKATQIIEEEVLTDCFKPYSTTKCETMSLPLKTIAERPSTQSTLRDSISIPENAPGVNAVYNIMTNAHISKTELQRNKIICEGKIEAYVLYLTNSPENPIYSIKKEIPFSYMIECKNETNTHQCEIKSTIKHASYNINANGEIDIRCLLSIDCILMKEFEINNIVDINISETEKQQGMLIYFASEGEEIWEISKRYGVPCKVLADHNGVESEKLHNRCKLFIPMR